MTSHRLALAKLHIFLTGANLRCYYGYPQGECLRPVGVLGLEIKGKATPLPDCISYMYIVCLATRLESYLYPPPSRIATTPLEYDVIHAYLCPSCW